jgi:hypothetical protein
MSQQAAAPAAAAAAPPAAGPQPLKFTAQHAAGHVSAAWVTAAQNLATLSAGADGRLVLQQLRPSQQLKDVKASEGPIHVCSVNPDGTMAAIADGTYIKVGACVRGHTPRHPPASHHTPRPLQPTHPQAVKLPELTIKGPLTRFTAAPCCAAWSKDGALVAAGADDGCVKLVTAADSKVRGCECG